jgi:hypothetical protein
MSRRQSAICFLVVLILFLTGFAPSVFALANRVFVSARSGNDANTCDNILAPCQTFAGAVTKLNPGGEAIVLDSGGYGKVTITQSLTIEAPPGVTAFVHPSTGDGITINAGATDTVVLRGLVLNGGPGNGIKANTVGTLHIENCVISGFSALGIDITAPGSRSFIKDTICRQNAFSGINIASGRASIDHCRFEGNSGDGMFVENADVTVRDSVSAGNLTGGFHAVSNSAEVTVLNLYECLSTNNSEDGVRAFRSAGSLTVRVANSSIVDNGGVGLNNLGTGTFESLGNSLVRGNTGGDTGGTITVVLGK